MKEDLKKRAEHAKKEQLFMGMNPDEILALLSERERLREALKQSNAALMEEERLSYAADGYGYKECDYSDAVVVARAALALGEQNG